MKRIEIIGVPGAGKSTLYNKLIERRSRSSWQSPDEIKISIARKLALTTHRSLKNLIKAYLSYVPGFRWINHVLLLSTTSLVERHNLWKHRKEWRDFLSLCTSSEQGKEEPIYYMWNVDLLVHHISDILLFEKYTNEGVVLCEESFFQRVGLLLYNHPHSTQHIPLSHVKDYMLPAGVIYLKISGEQAVRRIVERTTQKVIARHVGLGTEELYRQSEKEIDACNHIVNFLKVASVDVLEIDACLPIKEIVGSVEAFLNTKTKTI